MQNYMPAGSRLASRVILICPNQSILYLRAQEPKSKKVFWVMLGGGLDEGESFEEAAGRELQEEAGCSFTLGPYVWFRRHRHQRNGRGADKYERFLVPHTDTLFIEPKRQDGYISGTGGGPSMSCALLTKNLLLGPLQNCSQIP